MKINSKCCFFSSFRCSALILSLGHLFLSRCPDSVGFFHFIPYAGWLPILFWTLTPLSHIILSLFRWILARFLLLFSPPPHKTPLSPLPNHFCSLPTRSPYVGSHSSSPHLTNFSHARMFLSLWCHTLVMLQWHFDSKIGWWSESFIVRRYPIFGAWCFFHLIW